ncbi:hypothetical protein JCM10212_006124, partial [Sporobolomyces blumeae]
MLARSLRSPLPMRSVVRPSALAVSRPFSQRANPLLEASKVSSQPANADFKAMGKSAKEEVQGVGKVVAEAIAGANDTTSQNAPKENLDAGGLGSDLASIKDTIVAAVPKPAITWGAAGLLPYAGTAAASIHFARQAWLANEGL